MDQAWTEERLQSLIDDQVEESSGLDYKAAASLDRKDGKKREIAKDVSAFANSAGGRIIYGIAEYNERDKSHLPSHLDPVNRRDFSKEWLEQIINSNIQPRIDGIKIHPVSLSSGIDDVVYVVDIPQGSTAHQARDCIYYRRFNFQSVPMENHEVRDVMGRMQHPLVSIEFEVNVEKVAGQEPLSASKPRDPYDQYTLYVYAKNVGSVLAKYVNCFISVPAELIPERQRDHMEKEEVEGELYCKVRGINTHRDMVWHGRTPGTGPSRFDPVLPGLTVGLCTEYLRDDYQSVNLGDARAFWSVHADNATPRHGSVRLAEIPVERIASGLDYI